MALEESPGDFWLKATGCVYEGRELGLGARVRDAYYEYACVAEQGSVGLATVACVGPSGEAVSEGGVSVRGEGAFRCAADDWGNLRLVPAGCVTEEGGVAPLGRTFNGPSFWYTCTERNGPIHGLVLTFTEIRK